MKAYRIILPLTVLTLYTSTCFAFDESGRSSYVGTSPYASLSVYGDCDSDILYDDAHSPAKNPFGDAIPSSTVPPSSVPPAVTAIPSGAIGQNSGNIEQDYSVSQNYSQNDQTYSSYTGSGSSYTGSGSSYTGSGYSDSGYTGGYNGSSTYSRSNYTSMNNITGFCPCYDPSLGASNEPWTWQALPDNILFKSYMACKREPRLGIQFVGTREKSYWDCSIGGRVSVLRYGTTDPLYPQGMELEIDACAFPRLTLDDERELWSCDYRFGVPLAYRKGHWEYMFGYYHISSHLGDEKMVRYDSLERLNYVRDCMMFGVGYRPNADWRFYFHTEYGVWIDDGAEPWHFIFGFEYSPMVTGLHGAPFLAMCGRLREDVDFSGSFSLEAGWQWRSKNSHVFRTGLFYFNGYSDHYQFYKTFEEHVGWGFWYDF